jgi:hypothetical protein
LTDTKAAIFQKSFRIFHAWKAEHGDARGTGANLLASETSASEERVAPLFWEKMLRAEAVTNTV